MAKRPVSRQRAAQMGMVEKAVWQWWWGENYQRFDRCGLNVPVGLEPAELPETFDGRDQDGRGRTNLRIDAVIGKGHQVTLVEIKETGNLTAIGQLIGYGILFKRCYKGFSGIGLLLVAIRIPDAIKAVCEELGIEFEEAPADVWETISVARGLSVRASRKRQEEEALARGDVGGDGFQGVEEVLVVE